MKKWVRRLRGLLGLSAIGGAIGALFGMARIGLLALLGIEGLTAGVLFGTAAFYGAFAAVAAGGVGVLLATAGSRLTLQELSPWKAALCGAALGAAAPLLFALVTYTGVGGLSAFATIAVRFGLLGQPGQSGRQAPETTTATFTTRAPATTHGHSGPRTFTATACCVANPGTAPLARSASDFLSAFRI